MIVTNQDVSKPKPDPEGYIKVLKNSTKKYFPYLNDYKICKLHKNL